MFNIFYFWRFLRNFYLFFMSVCNVSFSVGLDGQFSTYQAQGNIESKLGMHRISFSLEKESRLSYVFSVVNGKVTISCKGDVSYTFTLKKGENYNFLIETFASPILCVVSCEDLKIRKTDKIVLITAKYSMDIGGNKTQNEFSLGVK